MTSICSSTHEFWINQFEIMSVRMPHTSEGSACQATTATEIANGEIYFLIRHAHNKHV